MTKRLRPASQKLWGGEPATACPLPFQAQAASPSPTLQPHSSLPTGLSAAFSACSEQNPNPSRLEPSQPTPVARVLIFHFFNCLQSPSIAFGVRIFVACVVPSSMPSDPLAGGDSGLLDAQDKAPRPLGNEQFMDPLQGGADASLASSVRKIPASLSQGPGPRKTRSWQYHTPTEA